MGRLDRGANIFCLESFRHQRLDGDRLSVRPLLELLYASRGTKFVHLTCSTRYELGFNLRQHKRYRSYGSVYLAFHGKRGRLLLADGSELALEELAEMARGTLAGCLVHMGSCVTALAEEQLFNFLEITGASVATGYTKSVDWIDSAALDMLLLDWAREYSNAKSLIDKLVTTYPGLIEATGFTALQG
ncbi:MAG TPA: DUF6642 family protein [Acidimicrobiia bacterium]|nr:DUF6642 family protein [Acidimicrobiia bacterium]